MNKKIIVIIITVFLLIILSLIFLKISNKKDTSKIDITEPTERNYSSNIIENVKYSSKDSRGNEYIILLKKVRLI